MAHEDRSINTTGDVQGVAFQAHVVHGDIYLNGAAPAAAPSSCEPPESWASAGELPAEIQHLLWAQERAADELPYQLRGARSPALGTVYVRQELGSGVEDSPADQLRPAPVLDEYGRLVEVPGVAAVRVAVRPPSKPLRAALDAEEHLVVVGGPGQGKSTLTLRLAAEIAACWSSRSGEPPIGEPVIPLRVTARVLAAHLGPSFSTALANSVLAEYGPYLNEPVDAAWLASRVAGCRWLLLVDALDEVADVDQRAKLVHALAAWASSPTYRIVLTTRPTERGALAALQRKRAARYELQSFDEESLELFAHGWFEGEEDLAHRFLQQIREAHLYELVEVPLLATIAAIVFEQYGERPLPGNQFELYESYLTYLRSSREVPDSFESCRLALVEHLGRTRLAADTSLIDAVEEWARQQEMTADELIVHLKAVGPFVQRGNDLAFLHHSFAEHVAATAEARDLPVPFSPERAVFQKLMHATAPWEEGRFARAVLLHYAYLHPAEADRMLSWLHRGASEQHLLAARLLGRHLPASAPMVDEFLVTVRRWAMTTQQRGGPILRNTSKATHHRGLIGWLCDLVGDDTAPWKSRAEAATALAVRVRGADAAHALFFLRSTVDDASARVEYRLIAAEALAQAGISQREAAERGLRSVLADPLAPGSGCRTAAVVLSALGAEARAHAVARLEALIADEDRDTVDLVEAATGLVEIGVEFHERCAAVFRAVLVDPVRSMSGRRAAAIGLASLGAREEAAEALIAHVRSRSNDSADRASAASALAALGPDYRVTAGKLLLAQLDATIPDTADRHQYPAVLARIGQRERAVALLLEVLEDRAVMWSEIAAAASSLAELGPSFRDDAAHHLEAVTTHLPAAAWEHTYALRLLSRLGEPHRSHAVARMRSLLSDRSIEPRTRCLMASELLSCAPELIGEIKERLLVIATTDLDPGANAGAWMVLRWFGPDLQEQAGRALLALAHLDPLAPANVGAVFGSAGAADRAVAAEVLLGIAGDDERGLPARLSAAEGLRSLGPSYVRKSAESVCGLIRTDVITDFPAAVKQFADCGRGIRRLVADELAKVADRHPSRFAHLWSVAEAIDLLGFRVVDQVLLSIADSEVAGSKVRALAAVALARLDPARREHAADRMFLAASSMWAVEWRNRVVELMSMGVDVHQRLRALVTNPNAFRSATCVAAWLLGTEGETVLRAHAADPYLKFDAGAYLRQLLVRVNPSTFPEAVDYHRQAMGDQTLPIATRCDAAKRLTQLDRTCFPESARTLFELAEDSLLSSFERAVAALALVKHFEPACPPRLTRLVTGLAHDPETGDVKRCELVACLSVELRTALELVLLEDNSANVVDRMPEPCLSRGRALRAKTERMLRDVLSAPECGVRERRQAVVELADLSPQCVPEAVALLLSDESSDAQSKAVSFGAWPQVHDRARRTVLDETNPLRARRTAALLIGKLTRTPSVRDFLVHDESASWRDRVDELWYADADDELRALRDDPAAVPGQRRRAAGLLDDYTIEDRAAAAHTLAAIAADRSVRPAMRWRAARDLAEYGLRGRAEAVRLLHVIASDDSLPVTSRAEAAYQLGRIEPPRRAEMLNVLRGLMSAPNPLHRRNVLESIALWSSWEAIDELYRMIDDEQHGPVVRLRCAAEIVSTRRDQRDRCAVVAREIAFDTEVPRHVRRRAAWCLAAWSDVCREEARALLREL